MKSFRYCSLRNKNKLVKIYVQYCEVIRQIEAHIYCVVYNDFAA